MMIVEAGQSQFVDEMSCMFLPGIRFLSSAASVATTKIKQLNVQTEKASGGSLGRY